MIILRAVNSKGLKGAKPEKKITKEFVKEGFIVL